jgi:hypothetical protein
VSTPSSGGGGSTPEGLAPRKALRDRALFRIVALLAVLAVALLVARSCGSGGDVSKEEAIAAAKRALDFDPECVQVRFFRSGLNAQPFWAVSLWTVDNKGEFERINVIRVSATTGKVVAVDRSPQLAFTRAQCKSPA